MGKVYDALRKAESERARRADPAAALPGHEWERTSRAQDQRNEPFWRRFVSRSRLVAGGAPQEDLGAPNKRRIAMIRPDSFIAEQFRSLRARIDSISAERPVRTLTITSAVKGEGKTIAAVNFALVTAMSVGRRVLLVDCDMREPQVHRTLGLRPETGLAEVLTDQAYVRMVRLAERWTAGVEEAIAEARLPWHVTRLGCRAEYLFGPDRPSNGTEAHAAGDFALERYMHLHALNRGILLTPFHNMVLMAPATTEDDVDRHTEAFREAVVELVA